MTITILSTVVLLGVLIFIHELGHFIAARLAGVGVITFSLGFGPRLLGFKRGGTDYRLSAFPLGGYVKMKGEEPGDPLGGTRDEFQSRPPAVRAAIVIAGPVMNLALSLFLFAGVYLIGVEVAAETLQPPVIGHVVADSPASSAGFAVGDRITAIGGREAATWKDVLLDVAASPEVPLAVSVQRGGEQVELTLVPESRSSSGEGMAGFGPLLEAVVGQVVPGSPADAGGLRPGDRIAAIDGLPVPSWWEMTRTVQGSAGKPLALTVVRGGAEVALTLTPKLDPADNVGRLGITPREESVIARYPLGKAAVLGFADFKQFTRLTFVTIKRLFTLKLSVKTLGGPIQIGVVSGAAAKSGLTAFLSLMAFISLQLGLLNLLPIPVLDGGHVVFLGIEKILGRPLSAGKREMAQQIGMLVLLALMVVISINDVKRVFFP